MRAAACPRVVPDAHTQRTRCALTTGVSSGAAPTRIVILRAMRRFIGSFVLLVTIGCGGEPSTPAAMLAPTPLPGGVPAPPSGPPFTGTVTDTLSGAPVLGFTATISGSRLTVAAPAYVTRDTRGTARTVDLIPQAGFDLEFYRQLTRGSLEGSLQPLRILGQAPSFYMEVEGAKGLSAQTAVILERVARRVVPQFTGGVLQVARWETGPLPREPQAGWIVIEREDAPGNTCGRALVGALAGQITLDGNSRCRVDAVFAHEVGHALGFWHVNNPGALMAPQQRGDNVNDALTDRERHHAAIAYRRPRGNVDIDVDP
jgi:hypothetical protein